MLFPENFVRALADMNATGYYLRVWEDGGRSNLHNTLRRDLKPDKIGDDKKTLKLMSKR